MQAPDFQRFRAVMNGIAKLYDREIDGVLLDAYWLSLRSWDLHDFEQAAGHLMCRCKFMPRPADFTELRNAGRPTSGEAFAKAVKHCASSAYRDGPHSDPLVDACVRAIGGYTVIAMCDEDKLPFLERRFAEHYEHISDARATREALPEITGESRTRISGPQSVTALLEQA